MRLGGKLLEALTLTFRKIIIEEFAGNADQDTVVYHELNPPITARYIRFRPVAWHGHISMRMELYGCNNAEERFKNPGIQ